EKAELMRKLGKKQLTLQLQHPVSTLPESLAGHALELSKDGSELTYLYDPRASTGAVATLLDDLTRAGIRFKDLQTTQSSLEDIFVSLVGGER
ncbi:MAG: multidrug ABC transporter ATP-binding protein, partial [Caldimonas sp.]